MYQVVLYKECVIGYTIHAQALSTWDMPHRFQGSLRLNKYVS